MTICPEPGTDMSCRNAIFTGTGSGTGDGEPLPPVHAAARVAMRATRAAAVEERRLMSVRVASNTGSAQAGWVV